jgi:hypothetical protein
MALSADDIAKAQSALTLLSAFLPANVQPYVADVAIDAPVAFAAFTQIKDAIAKLPAGTNFTQAVEAFGVPAGTPAHSVCQLVDLIIKQAKQAKPVPAA